MKKLILAATILALAGMNLQSARAGVSISVGLGGPAGFVAVRVPAVCPPGPAYCVPQVPLICAPVPRPAVIFAPPVVIVRPRPVCVTSENFVAVRGDLCDGPGYGPHRFGRAHHHYR